MRPQALYHGGAPGFKRGDVIEPHETRHIDGCPICAARLDENHAPERVFATPERIYAKYYASKWGRGSVYIVEPVGGFERSTEDTIESYESPGLRVLKVLATRVQLTQSERRHLYRVWHAADLRAGHRGVLSTGEEVVDAQLRRTLGISPREVFA